MKLDVVYATDENYAMYTGISIYSLLANNKKIDELTVHILDNDISSDSKFKLKKIAETFGQKVVFWDTKVIFSDLASKIKMKSTQTITAYACCFMAYIMDESFDKVLYMDGDSLICGDLSELCEVDMTDTYVCGSLDIAMPIVREKIGFKQDEPYINSGFLYMSLANIRRANLKSQINQFIEEVIPTSMHNDQDVVNGVFKEHIKVLPLRFNVLTPLYEKSYADIKWFYHLQCYYPDTEVEEAKKNPIFIHFTASSTKRPWIKGCKHPMKQLWDEYKSETEWKNIPDKPDNRSKKKMIIDGLFNGLNIHVYVFLIKLFGKKR